MQKFLMDASDMARWQAGNVVLPQLLSQFNGIPVEKMRFYDRNNYDRFTKSLNVFVDRKSKRRKDKDRAAVLLRSNT